MNKCDIVPSVGDIFIMKFCGNGSAQRGWRPGIVIQNNVGNRYSPNVVAIPLTSSVKNILQPTHVILKSEECGLDVDSMALCESPESIPKEYFGRYITSLSNEYMNRIAIAFLMAYPMLFYLNICEMISTKGMSVKMVSSQ